MKRRHYVLLLISFTIAATASSATFLLLKNRLRLLSIQDDAATIDHVSIVRENETARDFSAEFFHGGDTFDVVDHNIVIASLRLGYDEMATLVRITPSEIYILKTSSEVPGNSGLLYYVSRKTGSVGVLEGNGQYFGTLPNGDMIFASSNIALQKPTTLSIAHYGDVPINHGEITITMPPACQYITTVVIGNQSDSFTATCYTGENTNNFLGKTYLVNLQDGTSAFVQSITEPRIDGPTHPFEGATYSAIFTQD